MSQPGPRAVVTEELLPAEGIALSEPGPAAVPAGDLFDAGGVTS